MIDGEKLHKMNVVLFKALLPKVCDSNTSADPDRWTRENPLHGNCAVAALLAQDLFGGVILRASLENTEFAHMRSHYVNRSPDGQITDFTAAQFGDKNPQNLEFAQRSREQLLQNESTSRRYKLLKEKFERALHNV